MHWETLRYELAERRRLRRARRYAVAVCLMLAALSMAAHGQAPRIPDAERFYPDYRAAYAEAVNCTGEKPRPYEKIIWMRVPGGSFKDPYATDEEGKIPNIGEWVSPDTIFISANWTTSWVPKHEMIHYLRNDGKHPQEVFGEACHATWGFLPPDTTRMGPGTTTHGPAWKDE